MNSKDTIIAIATPPGRGGVGIVRVSGEKALACCELITGKSKLVPRKAYFCEFKSVDKKIIDQGLVLYFNAPHSFTGEDVIEFQAHGGPIILDHLLKNCLAIENVRLAEPGEFSKRAFLNDKIDLVQAEAIADLINANTEEAAFAAVRSLEGEFSSQINQLVELLIQLRMYVEAAIDFPEEEIDFLNDGKILEDLNHIIHRVETIKKVSKQGALLQEGLQVVIAGKPNAGKSSLLNALSGKSSAIVTAIEGTTRDILREQIHIEGLPLHIIDTAGLRETENEVEKIGIDRAWEAIHQANIILLLVDARDYQADKLIQSWPQFFNQETEKKLVVIVNKIDLTHQEVKVVKEKNHEVIYLSAKNQQGLDELKAYLLHRAGFETQTEGVFIARRRHLEAIDLAEKHLALAKKNLVENNAGELLAEECRLAQMGLSSIMGAFTADDLLGKIFSSFCIGK